MEPAGHIGTGDVGTGHHDPTGGGGLGPAEHRDQLGLPVAGDTGDADDLTGRDPQAHLVQHVAPVPGQGQALDLEHRLRRAARCAFGGRTDLEPERGVGVRLGDGARAGRAHHQRGELGVVHLGGDPGPDQPAVAQDHYPVGDLGDLPQLVRDEQDTEPGGGQPPYGLEEGPNVLWGQYGGRLVEDHHPAVVEERLDDLDPLPLADREGGHEPVRVEAHADPGHRLGDPPPDAGAVDAPETQPGERDVLGDGHRLDQGELLGHHADAGGHGVAG